METGGEHFPFLLTLPASPQHCISLLSPVAFLAFSPHPRFPGDGIQEPVQLVNTDTWLSCLAVCVECLSPVCPDTSVRIGLGGQSVCRVPCSSAAPPGPSIMCSWCALSPDDTLLDPGSTSHGSEHCLLAPDQSSQFPSQAFHVSSVSSPPSLELWEAQGAWKTDPGPASSRIFPPPKDSPHCCQPVTIHGEPRSPWSAQVITWLLSGCLSDR